MLQIWVGDGVRLVPVELSEAAVLREGDDHVAVGWLGVWMPRRRGSGGVRRWVVAR